MSSYISSFKNELKVIAVVVALIGGLNLHERIIFSHRDYEFALLRSFPVMADHLATEKGTSILLLGNSLTQVGYNLPQLREHLQHDGHRDLHVENISQTGSSPIEWYHNFANCFVRRGKTPNVIVINMAPNGIADGPPAGYRIGWLAHETAWRDVPEVLLKDLPDVDTDGQYLLARACMLYADRWDVRVDTVRNLIPDFQAGMNWANAAQLTVAKNAKPAAPPPNTYSLLTRLLSLASSNHARIILVAMPARETYDIDPDLFGIVNRFQVSFIDCRNVAGLTPDCFDDGWHLNVRGAKIFTAHMAERLSEAVLPFHLETTPRT